MDPRAACDFPSHSVAGLPRQAHLSFDSYLVGLFAFAAVSRDIPNQPLLYRIGISWFASFALISAVIYAAGERIQHRIPLERLLSEPAISAALIKRDT